MKMLLQDSRIYIEHHFSQGSQCITYHCWFLYELLHDYLKQADEHLLNKRYVERFISHPINILQYYQPSEQSTIDMPDELKTHFQMFGSLYEDQYERVGSQGQQKKHVTLQTFTQIANTIKNFILARFMIYKWISPFNEMYLKMM